MEKIVKTEASLNADTIPVLIFDGDCGFCTSSSNYILRKSTTPIRVEAWQLTDLTQYGLTPEIAAAKVQMYVDGELFAGHRAFSKILTLQRKWYWRLFGVFIIFPVVTWFSALGYYFVAKYRHKLPGGTPACQLGN